MSFASAKGYMAEHLAELWLERELGLQLERPRAGSAQDRGDFIGLPFTVSVKSRATLELSKWVDEMVRQATTNSHTAGVVLHKRVGKGQPPDWYVTTSGRLWLPMAQAFLLTQDRQS